MEVSQIGFGVVSGSGAVGGPVGKFWVTWDVTYNLLLSAPSAVRLVASQGKYHPHTYAQVCHGSTHIGRNLDQKRFRHSIVTRISAPWDFPRLDSASPGLILAELGYLWCMLPRDVRTE